MATFKFHCPHCDQHIETEEEYLGQAAHCPCCDGEIIIDHDIEYPESKVKENLQVSESKEPKNNDSIEYYIVLECQCPNCNAICRQEKAFWGLSLKCKKCHFSFSPKKSPNIKLLDEIDYDTKTGNQYIQNNNVNKRNSKDVSFFSMDPSNLGCGGILILIILAVLFAILMTSGENKTPSQSKPQEQYPSSWKKNDDPQSWRKEEEQLESQSGLDKAPYSCRRCGMKSYFQLNDGVNGTNGVCAYCIEYLKRNK